MIHCGKLLTGKGELPLDDVPVVLRLGGAPEDVRDSKNDAGGGSRFISFPHSSA